MVGLSPGARGRYERLLHERHWTVGPIPEREPRQRAPVNSFSDAHFERRMPPQRMTHMMKSFGPANTPWCGREPGMTLIPVVFACSKRTSPAEEMFNEVHGGRKLHFGARRTWLALNRRFPGHKISFNGYLSGLRSVLFVRRIGSVWIITLNLFTGISNRHILVKLLVLTDLRLLQQTSRVIRAFCGSSILYEVCLGNARHGVQRHDCGISLVHIFVHLWYV